MASNTPVQPQSDAYTGIDNLEVMQDAVNYNRHLLRLIQRHAPAAGRVLDFGAGTGQFALPMHAQGFKVTAVEPDTTLSRRISAGGVATAASAADLPRGNFDLIYSLNVLEHIEDDVAALTGLHAALAPTGVLLVYVPAFPILYSSMDAKVGHLRRYRRHTLAAAAIAAGLRIERLAYVDCLGFFATLLFKLIGQRDGSINPRALKLYDRVIFPVSLVLDWAARRWFGKNLLLVARKH